MTAFEQDVPPSELLAEVASQQAEFAEAAPRLEDAAEFPWEHFRRLTALGVVKAGLPPPYGTASTPAVFVELIESIAGGWVSLAEIVQLQCLTAIGLAKHGTPQLQEEYLPRAITGEWVGANCFSEPASGSDLSHLETTATRDGDGWVIDGHKAFVGQAGVASFLNVYARTSDAGLGGVSCFLVHADTPGVRVGAPMRKMGARSLPTAPITFDNVRVEPWRLIGRLNRGMLVASSVFFLGRLGIAACATGLSLAAVDHSVRYAKKRVQFGRPVFQFQGISALLADMATSTAAARQLLRHAASHNESDRDSSLLVAQAKLFATETAMRVTTDAVQVLGAYGYDCDNPVERWMREAKLLQIIEGTSQIQRVTIASKL
ncbi:MAG TPA: acyl-CoA dehydrogenase family protein [Jatrophihabitans sp.]|nr:acyl-CoA dehydrogenase family protein [Jatrophihabitans sp.]